MPLLKHQSDDNVQDSVVFIHGLWMPGIKLYYLGWKLKRRGFRVSYFHYRSMLGRIDDSARSLLDTIEAIEKGKVHLVGYSLGGIVVARMIEKFRTERLSRVALLGCPLQGSVVAEFLAGTWLGRFILGSVAVEGIAL
jgi:pimeloyl-ACP methyl ester carboxylesterase